MDTNPAFFEALTQRDRIADGVFIYAVKTTGIYCRPSCAARNPLAKNTAFYPTPEAAEKAGFRPCKKCHPGSPTRPDANAALIAAACRRIQTAETPLSLATLAAEAGISPFHFHRLFKSITGVTPKTFAAAARATRMKSALSNAPNVTQALYQAGYDSSARFYAAAEDHLGMAPATYRKGGAGEDISFTTAPCALGILLVARTPRGICAIALGDDPAALQTDLTQQFPRATITNAPDKSLPQILAFIDGALPPNTLPLDLRGTTFQLRVWAALRAIPPGQTASYAQIAASLGIKDGARAVAGACAANKLAIAIPCHRAVRGDGALAGYRWGPARKQALLTRERRDA
jgi:AraC family transcriptional regulator of adaptative response/methylated-DNA-[protein]-cysteine methyltransferase